MCVTKRTTIVPHDCIEIHHRSWPPAVQQILQLQENCAIIKPTYFRLSAVLHVKVLLNEVNECDNPLIDCSQSEDSRKILLSREKSKKTKSNKLVMTAIKIRINKYFLKYIITFSIPKEVILRKYFPLNKTKFRRNLFFNPRILFLKKQKTNFTGTEVLHKKGTFFRVR